ncbi:MAG: sulfotransferase [Caldilineaceae bacterium]|nr:sulfotransferase [Caldilineaceae bacterium]
MSDSFRHLPNFFVLGAMRAGTASLAHYLQQHPSICFTEPRDPHFFRQEQLYQRGLDYYLRSFCATFGENQWRGEASSTYFAHPQIVGPRLRAHFGDTPLKFIVLLREPVSRAWSHYLWRVQLGFETREFATALAEEKEGSPTSAARYFAEGCYVRLLDQWQTYYPAENFLLLLSEDLAADPSAQVQRVFRWLDADPAVKINISARLNRNRYSHDPETSPMLEGIPAWLRAMSERIWPNLWRRQRSGIDPNDELPPFYGTRPLLDPIVAAELRKAYQAEVLALSKLLGRYLSHWLLMDELLERPLAR